MNSIYQIPHDALLDRRKFSKLLASSAVMLAFGSASLGCVVAPAAKSNLHIPPAFSGESYEAVKQAIRAKASDSVLIAARLSQIAYPDTPAESLSWMYLYGSQQDGVLYNVFSGSAPQAALYSYYSLKDDEWAAIPSIGSLVLDADTAYAALVKAFPDAVAEVQNCNAFLMTYVAEDEDPLKESMKWFFDINYEQVAYDLQGDPLSEREDNDSPEGTTYYVDAVSGECGTV